mgnify:FL=1
MTSFLLALQFLTAIPVRIADEITPRLMGRTMVWFPIVGLLLGACLSLADWGLRLLFPATVSAAALLCIWVALTGALHLDGFLDCCDGLLVAKPPEKRLEILKDTHVGAFAVVGAVCLLLLKFTALLELPGEFRGAALVVIPTVTRAAMVYAARAYPYARPGPGLGQLFREGLTWREVGLAALMAVAVAVLVLHWVGALLVAVVGLSTLGVAAFAQRRIGGLTGDVYGAINEIAEVVALLSLLILKGLA